jgi:hypothetical protein
VRRVARPTLVRWIRRWSAWEPPPPTQTSLPPTSDRGSHTETSEAERCPDSHLPWPPIHQRPRPTAQTSTVTNRIIACLLLATPPRWRVYSPSLTVTDCPCRLQVRP